MNVRLLAVAFLAGISADASATAPCVSWGYDREILTLELQSVTEDGVEREPLPGTPASARLSPQTDGSARPLVIWRFEGDERTLSFPEYP